MKRQQNRGSPANSSLKEVDLPVSGADRPTPQPLSLSDQWEIRDLVRFKIDSSFKFHFLDAAFADLTGFDVSDFLYNSWNLLDIVLEQDRQSIRDALDRCRTCDSYFSARFRIMTHRGADKWLWMRGPAYQGGDTWDRYFIQGVISDISEQKQQEQSLKYEREFFEAFADTLDDGICIISEDCRIRYMNRDLISMVGDHTGEICDKALFNREGCCSLPVCSEGQDQHESCGFREYRHGSGKPRVFHVRSLPVTTSSGFKGRVGQFRDISKFKRLETKFKDFALRVRAIAKAANMADLGIFILVDEPEAEARFRFANQAFCRIMQYSFEELLGMTLPQIMHPDNLAIALERYRGRLRGEPMGETYEIRLVRKDGAPITVFFMGALSTHHGRVSTVGFVRDITIRKQLQESLFLSQRLASIGKLSAEIAHEINNPLTSILAFNKLIDKIVQQQPFPVERIAELQDYVRFVNGEAGRCANIARNLLDFSRHTEMSVAENDLHEIIEKTLGILRHRAEMSNIEIKTSYFPEVPRIQCDFSRIQQAFMNILWNAIEAMPNGGTLTVSISFETQPQCTELCKSGGNVIQVTITDTGVGIPKEDISHIFEPFYSTKKEQSGVGLGLSVAYGIIRKHNGLILVESKPGHGTSFMVQFPTDICVTCPFVQC